MMEELPSKYGAPLTGSDWVGLPLRIGHIPESGRLEDLAGEFDTVLVWSGGPSQVTIFHEAPGVPTLVEHCFERSSGMMDLLPAGTKMRSVEWSGRPSICTAVNFPRESVSALTSLPLLGLDASRGPRFGLLDSHVVDLVHRLQEQAQGEASLGALYIQSLSLALASYVSARYGAGTDTSDEPRSASLTRAQRAQLEAFVDQEIATNFGLVDLAELVGYSPDHFSRLFKQSFGQSPHQYVLSRRIDKAMAMLRDEAQSIAAIALACGFTDQGHLTKVFKQRVGMTPGVYRRN